MGMSKKNRGLPAEMFRDEVLMGLPTAVRMTGIALRFFADDQGRAIATPARIRGEIWPFDMEMTVEEVEDHLLQLAEVDYIELYTVNGRSYLSLAVWPAVDRGNASEHPPPPRRESVARSSRMSREELAVVGRGEPGSEGAGGRGGEGEGAEYEAFLRSLLGTPRPIPLCKRHQKQLDHLNTDCGPCASQRTLSALWVKAHIEGEVELTDDEDGDE